MKYGFNLDLRNIDDSFASELESYRKTGEQQNKNHSVLIRESLEAYNDFSREIDADELIKQWFPQVKADIFISHAHGDIDLVMPLSGWLQEKCGLKPFVDSSSWKHIATLTEKIKKENRMDATEALLHGHIMLATSLMRMISNCKCLLFVNTPKSKFNNGESIRSPWIFLEMVMSEILLRQIPTISREGISESLSKTINYPGNIEHLSTISASGISEWAQKLNHTMHVDTKLALLQGHTEIRIKPRKPAYGIGQIIKDLDSRKH